MPENLPRKRPKGAHEGALRCVIPPANLETSPFGFVLRFDLRGNKVSAHIIPRKRTAPRTPRLRILKQVPLHLF